ncbi:MAG: tail-specific protease, partial [Gelidibacter sp.]
MKDIMKRNYKVLLLALMLAFASCSFTTKTFDDPDRDKLLMQLIVYVLEEGHYSPRDLNDAFSEQVFASYLDQLDPFKRYFYASDIKEFEAYKDQIDDQLKSYDLSFFNLTHQRLLQRIEESQILYKDVLAKPFDYNVDEDINTDYKKLAYVNSKKEMRDRWRTQLKFSTIANYDDLISQQENTVSSKKKVQNMTDDEYQMLDSEMRELPKSDKTKDPKEMKSLSELEAEARKSTLNSLNELFDYINERQREDWFAVYLNAIVADFDPHTFYYAPEDKE